MSLGKDAALVVFKNSEEGGTILSAAAKIRLSFQLHGNRQTTAADKANS
ncbi:hypothetical protein [Brevibacillus gelatini]|nr:hypothetical protein [Brevibacillus gelatini]